MDGAFSDQPLRGPFNREVVIGVDFIENNVIIISMLKDTLMIERSMCTV